MNDERPPFPVYVLHKELKQEFSVGLEELNAQAVPIVKGTIVESKHQRTWSLNGPDLK